MERKHAVNRQVFFGGDFRSVKGAPEIVGFFDAVITVPGCDEREALVHGGFDVAIHVEDVDPG